MRSQQGAALGVAVIDIDSGRQIYGYNAETPLIPASVMKVLTTTVALKELGPDFRFETRVFYDVIRDGFASNLYVQGGGDPDLTTEKLWLIARAIKQRGVNRIGRLVLDGSRFTDTISRRGVRAYQSGTSALALNFNSFGFEVCPTVPGKNARTVVDPPEAGVVLSGRIATVKGNSLAFQIDEAALQMPPSYRLSGSIGAAKGCQVIYRSVPDPQHYFGEVLRQLLKSLGVIVPDKAVFATLPPGAKRLWTHKSKALSLILEDLNHYSNNFTAEQITTVLGTSSKGTADHRLGLARMADYLKRSGFDPTEFYVADGSGLSRENRLSARIVTRILFEVHRDKNIQPEFEKSLSVAGRNGTLRKRDLGALGLRLRGKTGTLDGVSALSGYLFDVDKRKLAFAILQNRTVSRDRAFYLEARVVKELYSGDK
ncbi:MAG: D-alanyl-D-alanine carboxypeptidase/D-alanyl-D-alanine-endopeptidase [Deltaproteobacteria bacterium]|nr:D-alanyl-D-alanine carboxypeptidase/D-alanyl-D-alanine-endopeptidase [Deltaproteobacteria bacterium]